MKIAALLNHIKQSELDIAKSLHLTNLFCFGCGLAANIRIEAEAEYPSRVLDNYFLQMLLAVAGRSAMAKYHSMNRFALLSTRDEAQNAPNGLETWDAIAAQFFWNAQDKFEQGRSNSDFLSERQKDKQQSQSDELEWVEAFRARPKMYCGDDHFLSCMALVRGYSFFLLAIGGTTAFCDFFTRLDATVPSCQRQRYTLQNFWARKQIVVYSADPIVSYFCQEYGEAAALAQFWLSWEHYQESQSKEVTL